MFLSLTLDVLDSILCLAGSIQGWALNMHGHYRALGISLIPKVLAVHDVQISCHICIKLVMIIKSVTINTLVQQISLYLISEDYKYLMHDTYYEMILQCVC